MTEQTPRAFSTVAAIAGGVGFVIFVLLMILFGVSVTPALFLGILVAIGVAAPLLLKAQNRGERVAPAMRDDTADHAAAPGSASGSVGAASGAGDLAAAGTDPAADDTIEAGAPPPTAPPHQVDTSDHSAPPVDSISEEDRTDDTIGGTGTTGDHSTATTTGAGVSTSTEETDPAPSDSMGDGAGGDTLAAPSDDAAPVPEAGTTTGPATAGTAAAEGPAGDAPKWRSSQLAGSGELAGRKGAWRYERPDTAGGETPAELTEPGAVGAGTQDLHDETAGRETAVPVAAPAGPDPTVGTEPARLSSPREGGPDDLTRIKGVGPKLQTLLNRLGFYHFDQIAVWSDQEVAWVDEHLEGFKGRVARDSWVGQAGILASGEETEFSSRR